MGGALLYPHSVALSIHTLTRVDFHHAASWGNATGRNRERVKVSGFGSRAEGKRLKGGGGGQRGFEAYFL